MFYFMFQAIWNSLEGYYFWVEKIIILVEWGRPPPSRGKFHQNNYFFLDPFRNNSYSISCEQSHETDTDDRKQLTMLLHVENTISYLGWNY